MPDRPDTWTEDLVYRVNRLRVANYLGQLPSVIDTMPMQDYEDVLQLLRADSENEQYDYQRIGM